MTKEEEEQRASAALYALKRRYRTPQELMRNLDSAYSAIVDCEDECFTDILLHITHSGRLLEEGAEMRDAEFDANFAASQLESFVEDPDAYRAEYRESEEEMEREENDPNFAPPVRRSSLAIIRTAWHGLMMAALPVLTVFLWQLARSGDRTFGEFVIISLATTILCAGYAPWYVIVGFGPFWFFYAAVTATCYGGWTEGGGLISQQPITGNAESVWIMSWFTAWLTIPLLKGIWHQWRWMQEARAGLPMHKATKHPLALLVTALAITVGMDHLSRKKE